MNERTCSNCLLASPSATTFNGWRRPPRRPALECAPRGHPDSICRGSQMRSRWSAVRPSRGAWTAHRGTLPSAARRSRPAAAGAGSVAIVTPRLMIEKLHRFSGGGAVVHRERQTWKVCHGLRCLVAARTAAQAPQQIGRALDDARLGRSRTGGRTPIVAGRGMARLSLLASLHPRSRKPPASSNRIRAG